MKIPETSANIGAYYGNEDNGQWQPNGVIVDGGVGGGVVGSGDAGFIPPVYQVPRPHIPAAGYVMAGAYYEGGPAYAPPPPHDDFADYMWMENEEEFDKQVMQQLEEEALMEQCIEAMLEDEQRERQRPHNGHGHGTHSSNSNNWVSLEEAVSRSTLNPLAAEFVPTGARSSNVSATESKEQIVEVSAKDDIESKSGSEADVSKESAEDEKRTDAPKAQSPSSAPIEASDKKKEQNKKDPGKSRTEPKKKSQTPVSAVKSETKVPPKKDAPAKKETKTTKSEVKLEEVERAKETAVSLPEPTPEEEGPKPINYAAAAKANKAKKPSPPPVIEKTPPPVTEKAQIKSTEKSLPPKDKVKATTDKQNAKATEKSRKNSTK